jgi:drug/metabolite transporter (DMT)-like permease
LYAPALLAVGRWPTFDGGLLYWGVAIGATIVVGSCVFYQALVVGPIAVVCPISSAYSAVTVALVVIFLGEHLNAGQLVALVLTLIGVALASADLRAVTRTLAHPLGARLAVIAALTFGVWGALLAAASRAYDPLAIVLVARTVASLFLATALAAGVASRVGIWSPMGVRDGAIAGVFDVGAQAVFALGARTAAAVVVTASGTYPLLPAIFGVAMLGERLAPNQYVGVAMLVAALVVLGLST